VRNGTGRVGQGQSAADQLQARGFTITAVTDDRAQKNDATVIKYAPGANYLKAAVVVARYLDGTPVFEEDPALASTSTYVAVVIGRDFSAVRTDPRPLTDFADVLARADQTGTTLAPAATTAAPPDTIASVQSQSFVPHPDPNVPC